MSWSRTAITSACRCKSRRLPVEPSLRRMAQTWPSSSSDVKARAIVYNKNGDPDEMLKGISFILPPPTSNEVRVRFKLSPQNPADLNVIQGAYPDRPALREDLFPEPLFVGGSEGLASVDYIPSSTKTALREGDLVIMGKSQLGTWSTHANIPEQLLFPLPKSDKLSDIAAATLSINPCTAYRMLKDPVPDLQPGDWIIQNGANSQVGLAVIQLAKAWGLKTINFVRDRDNISGLTKELQDLGGDLIFPYSALDDKTFKKQLSELTATANIRLGLNCVSGPTTTAMAKLLGKEATLVTYGAMSKQPLSLPSSLFIFKSLRSEGFWMTTWYQKATREERVEMTNEIVNLIEEGKFKETQCDIVDLTGSDEEIGHLARKAITALRSKKLLFRFP